jgi:heat shock protein HslJ
MGIMSTARGKVLWVVAFLVVSLVISGCTGIKPYEPRNNREEGPEKGLFTGSQGEFVIFRKGEEPQKESEDEKSPGEPERAAQPEPASGLPDENTHSTDPHSVLNRTWQWVSTITPVEKIVVANPERYTIILANNGTLQARFDCNRGGGEFKISPGKLSFGPLMSTRMACPEDSLDGPFIRDLQRVTSFFVQDGLLYLELPYDSGTMKFRPEG